MRTHAAEIVRQLVPTLQTIVSNPAFRETSNFVGPKQDLETLARWSALTPDEQAVAVRSLTDDFQAYSVRARSFATSEVRRNPHGEPQNRTPMSLRAWAYKHNLDDEGMSKVVTQFRDLFQTVQGTPPKMPALDR